MRPWLGWHVAWPAHASPPRHAAAAPVGAGRRPDRAVRGVVRAGGGRGVRSPTRWRWRRWTRTGRRTRAWCCSRASARTAFASSPTSARPRRASSKPPRARRSSSTGASSTARCGSGAASSSCPTATSDAYFASRSRDAQIGAWASPQSQPIADRGTLDARVTEAGERFAGDDDPPARVLGRVPRAARADRVLAGPGRPPARPLPSTRAPGTGGRSSGWRPDAR